MSRYERKRARYQRRTKKRGFDIFAYALCLVFSVFLWLFVMQMESPENTATFEVKVELENVPGEEKGIAIVSGYDNIVEVEVKGKKTDLQKYTAEDIKAAADASSVTTSGGKHRLDVSVILPPDISLVSCLPATVSVEAEEMITRTVDLAFEYTAELEAGKSIDWKISPLSITITGPSSVIGAVKSAVVFKDLGNISSSRNITESIKLHDAYDNEIENPYVLMSEKTATVTVTVYEQKSVGLRVDYKYGYFNDSNVKITIEPANVIIAGESSVLAGISQITLKTLDEKSINGNMSEVITIPAPSRTSIVGDVASATITVTHINTVTKKYETDNIIITGAEEYILLTDKVNITLRGTEEELEAVKSEDIELYASLNELTEKGQFTVPVKVNLPEQYRESVYELNAYYIEVIIK